MSSAYDKKSIRNRIIALVLVCALVLTGIVMVFWGYYKDTNKMFTDVKFAQAIASAITASNKGENADNYKTVNAVNIDQKMLDEITGLIFTVNAVDSEGTYAPVIILSKAEYTDYYISKNYAKAEEEETEDTSKDESKDESKDDSKAESADTSVDASVDASVDTSVDASVDASVDTSVDASTEASADESKVESKEESKTESKVESKEESKTESKEEEKEEEVPTDYYYVVYDLEDLTDLKLFRNLKLIDISGLNTRSLYQQIQQYYYYYYMYGGTSASSNPYMVPAATFTDPTIIDREDLTSLDVFSDLSKLEYLCLGYSGLTSLDGLEKATNLKFAELSNCKLTDVSKLGELSGLTSLNLSGNKLESLDSVTANKDLELLYLNNCGLKDIKDLSVLTKLEGVDVSGNPLASLDGLEGSKGTLKNLYATNCVDSDIEINEDESMDEEAVETEKKKQRTLVDASALEGFVKLETLDISGNKITNVDFLASMESLTTATLTDNEITALPKTMGKLTKLTTLSAGNNQIAAIDGLREATALTTITLDENKLTSLEGIGKLTKLTSLSAAKNEIADLGDLGGATALTTLTLNENKISDVKQIATLTKLTSINLSKNEISDLTTLGEKLKSVTSLNLSGNEKLTTLAGIDKAFDKAKLTSINLSLFDKDDKEVANDKITMWEPVFVYTKATVTGMTDKVKEEFETIKKEESSSSSSSGSSSSKGDSSADASTDASADASAETSADASEEASE